MKTNVTLLLAATLCINIVYAINNPIQNRIKKQKPRASFGKTTIAYAPQLSVGYYWNDFDEPQSWEFNDSTFTQYNTNGIMTFEERVFSGSYKVRNYYILNGEGNLDASYRLDWNPAKNQWDSVDKSFYTYDNTGLEIEFREYRYDANSNMWKLDYAYQKTYTKGSNGQITEEINKAWIPYLSIYRNADKTLYNFNTQGQIDNLESLEWDTVAGVFAKSYRVKDLVWHKFFPNNWEASLLSSMLFQEWNGNAYVDSERGITNYDSKDNIILDKWEEKVGTQWVISYWDQYTLTYNNDGALIESVEESYDADLDSMVNNYRQEFSNFITYNGLNERINEGIQSYIYPNPVSLGETLQVNSTSASTIAIYNIEGKLIQNAEVNNGTIQLQSDINGKGLYYYHLKDKQNQVISTGKLFIK